MKELLFIAGFMGAGKTTLAELAAAYWNLSFYDTDNLLQCHGPIHQQLTADAQLFRQREAELIRQLCQLQQGIIALGGGAVEQASTRQLLRGKDVIFLDPGVNICWQRVQAHQQRRPLANRYQDFVSLYHKRHQLYLEICRWHITVIQPPQILLAAIDEQLFPRS